MRRLICLAALGMVLSACSGYTCPLAKERAPDLSGKAGASETSHVER